MTEKVLYQRINNLRRREQQESCTMISPLTVGRQGGFVPMQISGWWSLPWWPGPSPLGPRLCRGCPPSLRCRPSWLLTPDSCLLSHCSQLSVTLTPSHHGNHPGLEEWQWFLIWVTLAVSPVSSCVLLSPPVPRWRVTASLSRAGPRLGTGLAQLRGYDTG